VYKAVTQPKKKFYASSQEHETRPDNAYCVASATARLKGETGPVHRL